ncbi:hypothetical protein [Dendronalium sp. ChiSLP03b]|uniref:hypothetical protein n=1 Tax=Dendronalium sp. ChiSLP03b TaxID=3075381 RepID=UPI002AD52090|nr:hypothetical protein [Dendronalium sp. ChiSLP03b]MDZ8204799.1 hypothetical protein [Dendronalium sp. ChiSLP03b]
MPKITANHFSNNLSTLGKVGKQEERFLALLNYSAKTQYLQDNILNAGIAIAQYPDVGSGRSL